LAMVRAWAGRADQATPLFQSALQKEKDEAKRQEYQTEFMKAMAAAGKSVEVYAVLPDAPAAFRFLAADSAQHYRMDDLRRLVAAHAKKQADDPLLPFYEGQVYIHDGRYARAEQAFRAGMAKPPDASLLVPFRASRVLARYHTGQALSAYG